MSLEILQNNRLVSEAIATLAGLSEGFQKFAPDLGPLGHEAMFAAGHLEHAILRLRRIQEAMSTAVACAEQAMDEARAMARQGRRVPVAGGVLRVGSWS
jgi:hypothetical protein